MKDILQPGINCWKIDEVSESGLLIDAKDYYRAFCDAAATAERYILLAGWQFDSNVALIREGNGGEAGVTLISFLDQLCEKKIRSEDLHPGVEFQRHLLHRSRMAAELEF